MSTRPNAPPEPSAIPPDPQTAALQDIVREIRELQDIVRPIRLLARIILWGTALFIAGWFIFHAIADARRY